MIDVDIGWLAGIMDGEGTVTLMKCYGKRSNRFRQPTLSMTSTDLEILMRVQVLAGGVICKISKYKDRMKQSWKWCLNGSGVAFEVLRLIGPHMTCPKKKLRINFLLEQYAQLTKGRGRGYSPEERAAKIAFEEAFFALHEDHAQTISRQPQIATGPLSTGDIGWIAGIIDGEGTITLATQGGKRFRQPTLSVTSTDRGITGRIQEAIAGNVTWRKRPVEGRVRLTAWTWKLNGAEVVFSVLRLIVPYLRCPKKLRRADLLLTHYSEVTRRNGRYSPDARAAKLAFESSFFALC